MKLHHHHHQSLPTSSRHGSFISKAFFQQECNWVCKRPRFDNSSCLFVFLSSSHNISPKNTQTNQMGRLLPQQFGKLWLYPKPKIMQPPAPAPAADHGNLKPTTTKHTNLCGGKNTNLYSKNNNMMMFRGGPTRAHFFHRRYPTNREQKNQSFFHCSWVLLCFALFCFVCCEEMERATADLTLAINFYATKQTDH